MHREKDRTSEIDVGGEKILILWISGDEGFLYVLDLQASGDDFGRPAYIRRKMGTDRVIIFVAYLTVMDLVML